MGWVRLCLFRLGWVDLDVGWVELFMGWVGLSLV